MGQLNLSEINSLDTIKNSKYTVNFSKMPAVSGFSSNDVNLRTVTCDLPKKSVGIIEQTIRENTIRVPGKKSYSQTVALTLMETVDMKTIEFIRQWGELCNEYDTNKIASRTDREATIQLYLCDDQWNSVWNYKLSNCWLSDYTLPQLGDGSSPELIKPTLTICYTYFEENKMS